MRRLSLAAIPLLLASCGSDGGSGAGTVPVVTAPTPTPTPAPTPTPTPTPAPTPAPGAGYVTYDQLSGAVVLASAQTGYFSGSTPPRLQGFRGFGEGPAIRYDATARSYSLTVGTTTDDFSAAEIDPAAPAGTRRYVKANRHSLAVVQPVAGGRGLDYVRYLGLATELAPGSADPGPLEAAILTGVATRGNDVPTQGRVTFARTTLAGDAYVTANGTTTAYSLNRSTLTVTVDFAAGTVTGRLTLVGTPRGGAGGGADVALSTLDISGSFDGASRFTPVAGDFTPVSPSALAGVLFGPQGAEAGLLLHIQATTPAGARMTLIALGAAGR